MVVIKELSKFSAATICEALGNINFLPSSIKPITQNMKVCGPAYTVQTMPRDNVLLHRAYAYQSLVVLLMLIVLVITKQVIGATS